MREGIEAHQRSPSARLSLEKLRDSRLDDSVNGLERQFSSASTQPFSSEPLYEKRHIECTFVSEKVSTTKAG